MTVSTVLTARNDGSDQQRLVNGLGGSAGLIAKHE